MLEMLEAARASALAGAATLRGADCDARRADTKSSSVDLVTAADVASGVAVIEALEAAYPGSRYVCEEAEVFDSTDAERGELDDDEVWVIDPLDGTTSFVHGYPGYSVSVALMRDGEPVLGVVHDVPRAETYAAARGLGATLDDVPLAVSIAARLEDALMMTGFPYDRDRMLSRQLPVFAAFMQAIHGVRRDGSAALDLCHVAAGRADGFWEFGLSPWDTAAGVVILEEAGGVVTDVRGEPWSAGAKLGIVAANPTLHPLMLGLVRQHDPEQAG